MVLDTLLSFRTVEPSFYKVVEEVVHAHTDHTSTRHAAMIGAAMSYSTQLSTTSMA
ncbi:MAG: hypothetical protein WAW63_03300 [Candidatus Saccharimonadales bacterium]